MNWQPQDQGLTQIIQVLQMADSPDKSVQISVQKKLNEFAQVPDFLNYLMFILTTKASESENVRAVAGLVLKNTIRSQQALSADVVAYLQQQCLTSIGDPLPLVRSTVTTLITTIVTRQSILTWPQLLPSLLGLLDSPDVNALQGSLSALQKICEDSGRDMGNPQLQQYTSALCQKLVLLTQAPAEKVRIHSLTCYNFLIQANVPAALHHVSGYIAALSTRATDPTAEVRALVCRAFVHILDTCPEVLIPCIQPVAEFMLFAAQDASPEVSLDACEFWLSFAEHPDLKDNLESLLPRLIPVLMSRMVYSDYDIVVLGGEEDDESVPDKQEDIKPRHYKAKTHASENSNNPHQQPANEEEDEDEEDDDEIYAEWNLRKCSAATIDVLANNFGNDILEFLLPILNQQLFHKDWKVREAGVLALGAIAEGCMSGVEPHLNQLAPFLFQALREPKPLIRSITCWTLGRYCSWYIAQDAHFQTLLKGLLDMILDRNKRVQEAACSAFATFEEEAREAMIPYLDHILQVLNTAFNKYQSKNLLILYDAVGTLAESVGDALSNPKYVELIMTPLIHRWNSLTDDDTGLFPLLECLSSIAIALGPSFATFAPTIYQRCTRLIKRYLTETSLFVQDPRSYEAPDADFMIVSLDLLSGMVQGMGPTFEALLLNSQPSLFELIAYGMKDGVDEVRQSSFAVVGDLAISCFNHLKIHLATYIPILVEQSQPSANTSISSSNNACWALGEISLRYGDGMGPYLQPLLERVIGVLNHPQLPRTIRENAAITIGRISFSNAAAVAPRLELFSENWCKALRTTRDNLEKESAFLGFCNVILLNPQGMVKSLAFFCEAVASWNAPSPQLKTSFHQVLHGYKNLMAAEWPKYFSTFPPQISQKLAEIYQL